LDELLLCGVEFVQCREVLLFEVETFGACLLE
jgi:hypothetical protein